MIDINTILAQALAAAVQQATAPLLERIAALETGTAEMASVSKERHERQLFVLQHLNDRIAALETRLLALENNPAQGVDTTLEQRVAALETAEPPLTLAALLEHLDDQAWFWDKIRRFTDGAVEQAIEQHCEEYDHDDMLMSDALPDMDDYVTKDDLRDEMREIMDGATVSIRF